ncbi:MAG TPA: cytochrome c peroxidase [Polyangiaceae bacterium]
MFHGSTHRRSFAARCAALSIAFANILACGLETPPDPLRATERAELDEPLQPLPAGPTVDPARAKLGEILFADASLSSDGTVSCLTCHPLDRAGTDGLAHSRGARGKDTALNTPSIFNLPFAFRYNWSGAYLTLEDEFDAPVQKTFSTTWREIEKKVQANPELSRAFAAAYPDGPTIRTIKDALARYIETLTTPGSRFDAFLNGDADALSRDERRGYALFKELGCSSCHQGAAVGAGSFQRFGVMRDYFAERGGPPPASAELGRFNTTGNPSDRFVFRVPSLRNVARTAPYFHDGSAPTLEQAVTTMARVQLGEHLSPDQVSLIVGFLRTLTGTFRGSPL